MIDYYYKGNKLYNVKKLKWDYCSYEILANWKDKNNKNKENLGKFKLSELTKKL